MNDANTQRFACQSAVHGGSFDHFWRNGLRSKLSRNRTCKSDRHDSSTCPSACVLQRVIIDQLSNELPRITLRLGTTVSIMDSSGLYHKASIHDQGVSNVADVPFADRSNPNKQDIRTWACLLDNGEQPHTHAIVHMSQIRPFLSRSITPDIVSQETGIEMDEQQLHLCRGIRRGDLVVTTDDVTRLVIVNDVQLMLLVDRDCNPFNYLQADLYVYKSCLSVSPESLVYVGRQLAWTAPSLLPFVPPTTLDGKAVEGNVVINMITEVNRDQEEQELMDSHFTSARQKFNTLGVMCSDQMTDTDDVAQSLAAQKEMLQLFSKQADDCQTMLNNLKGAIGEMNTQQLLAVANEKRISERMTAALGHIGAICDSAKKRHDTLWIQRTDFHRDIISSIHFIQEDFDAIASRMNSQMGEGGREENVQSVLDVLRYVKLIATEGDNSGEGALVTVSKIKDVLRTVFVQDGAAASTDNTSISFTQFPTDATEPQTTSTYSIEKAAQTDGRPVIPPARTASMSGNLERHEQQQPPCATSREGSVDTSGDIDILGVDTVGADVPSERNAERVVADDRLINEVPTMVKNPKQPAVLLRRWGEQFATEVHFMRNVLVMPSVLHAKAVDSVGGPPPAGVKLHQLMAHVRSFCNCLSDALGSVDTSSEYIFLPIANDAKQNTIKELLAQQNVGLRFVLQTYIDTFKAVERTDLLKCFAIYVGDHKARFLKARAKLEVVVADKKLLMHLY